MARRQPAIALHAVLHVHLLLEGSTNAGCTTGSALCYADFVTPCPSCPGPYHRLRVLGPQTGAIYAGPVSREYCAQLCSDRKSALAGLEGTQCFCGSVVNSTAKLLTGKDTCGAPVPKPTPVPPTPPPYVPPQPCVFNDPGCSELYNPCRNLSLPYHAMPFCNPELSMNERVDDMIRRTNLSEKIAMLGNRGSAVAGLGTKPYNWWSEASTGVANWVERRGASTETTKFAFPISTAMSFNRTLWQATGGQIGREARAMMNAGTAFSSFWAPVINLAREPRWGRNIETPGEDPYLTSQYAIWYTKGMQESPDDAEHIQASACCKHFVGNSMEFTTQKDGESENRASVDSNISMRDLVDSYMVPFQACVEVGKVSGLMCSYNSVNGVPSCANDWLLNDIARGEWQFDGYITSDCDADENVFTTHHYLNHSENQVVADVLRAGTDVDCHQYGPNFVATHAADALGNSTITELDIDARLRMQYKMRIRLGHFDPSGPLDAITENETLCTEEAIAISMQGAIQSVALFKNLKRERQDGAAAAVLPLDPVAVGTVAVIGPLTNYSEQDTGYYGPHDCCGRNYWNVIDAVAQYAQPGRVVSTFGVPTALSNDTSGISAAVQMAGSADTVVLAIGTDLTWAAEGHDATNISLTDAQLQLVQQTAAVATQPVVVVLLTATPLDLTPLLDNPKVGAILHTGQLSVTMLAVAEVLYGKVSPAGRAVQTFYPSSYQDQISIFDFSMRPGVSLFVRPDCVIPNGTGCPMGTNPGRTHRFYTGKAVIPFGYGLSYTEFSYGITSAPTGVVSLDPVRDMIAQTKRDGRIFPAHALLGAAEPLIPYEINVTNTGTVDSDEVVLGFLNPPGAGVNGVPLQQLYGFERVHVRAGQTVTVPLYPSLADFSQVNAEGERHALPGVYTFHFGVSVARTGASGMGYAEHKVTTQ